MSYDGKKVLVTGGAGFIGSNIVKSLIKQNAKVAVLDDLSTGRRENIPRDSSVKFVKGDVFDYDIVKRLVKDSQIVFHLAARNISAALKNPREDFQVNIGGTLNVLLAAKEVKNIERIAYSSSASVYGNPRHLPINEDELHRTLSPYSASKLGGENYCIAFYELYDLPIVILRYSNVYGPGQDPTNPYCGVISKFISSINKNGFVRIHGDGRQTRDFTYIDDVVDATLLAGTSNKVIGDIFNVGTGTETSILEVVKIFEELYSKKMHIEHVDRRDIDNIRRRVLNIESIRIKLKWVPRTILQEGLSQTIAWFNKNKIE